MEKDLIKYQYYKTTKKVSDYHGVRYFRFSHNTDFVTQVCIKTGDAKRGKGNYFGTYLMARLTFLANYLAMGIAEPCTKKEYDKMFNKMVDFLK